MVPFSVAPYRPYMGQAPAPMVVPAASPSAVPTVGPDPIYTGYTGLPGFVETLGVLVLSGAAAWAGITVGMKEKENKTLKAAGWVGGVGSILLALLYLGGKSGYGPQVGLPAVRLTPA